MHQVKFKNLPLFLVCLAAGRQSALAFRRSKLQSVSTVTDEGERLTITTTVIRTRADFTVRSTVDSTGNREADKALQQHIYNVPLVLLILLSPQS